MSINKFFLWLSEHRDKHISFKQIISEVGKESKDDIKAWLPNMKKYNLVRLAQTAFREYHLRKFGWAKTDFEKMQKDEVIEAINYLLEKEIPPLPKWKRKRIEPETQKQWPQPAEHQQISMRECHNNYFEWLCRP